MLRPSPLLIKMLFEFMNWLARGNLWPLVSVAAIIERDGSILFIDRSDGLGLGFPGGILKWNETTIDGLRREVKEETGFTIEEIFLIGAYSGRARDPRFSCVEIAYAARIRHGATKCSPEGRVVWVSERELPEHLAFDNTQVLADYWKQKQLLIGMAREEAHRC